MFWFRMFRREMSCDKSWNQGQDANYRSKGGKSKKRLRPEDLKNQSILRTSDHFVTTTTEWLVWFHRNINAGGTFTHVFVEEEDDEVNELHFNLNCMWEGHWHGDLKPSPSLRCRASQNTTQTPVATYQRHNQTLPSHLWTKPLNRSSTDSTDS